MMFQKSDHHNRNSFMQGQRRNTPTLIRVIADKRKRYCFFDGRQNMKCLHQVGNLHHDWRLLELMERRGAIKAPLQGVHEVTLLQDYNIWVSNSGKELRRGSHALRGSDGCYVGAAHNRWPDCEKNKKTQDDTMTESRIFERHEHTHQS
jgi:hypothetical protein